MPAQRAHLRLSRSLPCELFSAGDGAHAGLLPARGVELSDLFRLGWAIVLQVYSAEAHIRFCHVIVKPDDHPAHKYDAIEEAESIEVDLAAETPLKKLLHQVKQRPAKYNREVSAMEPSSVFGSRFSTFLKQHEGFVADEYSLKDDAPKIVLSINREKNRYYASLNYPPNAVDDELAERVTTAFRTAVHAIIEDDSQPLSSVGLCSDLDIEQLMSWNPPLPSAIQSCVHERISDRCREQPDCAAVSAWDGSFTYRELEDTSNNIALHLRGLGVRSDDFIPLCFEKSKWAVAAVLGVLKAGAAYAFLDPSSPVSRLREICSDLGATYAVVSNRNVALGRQLKVELLCVSELLLSPSESEYQRPEYNQSHPHDALYTVFTSGSTGKPKGAVMEHSAFLSTVMANGPELGLDANSRVLQFASYAYDVSNRDMLMTLLFGGCICIPSETDRFEDLSGFIVRHQANWASLTPTTADLLDPDEVKSLEHLIMGGEPMRPSQVALWTERVRLLNAYGPCECAAVTSLCREVSLDSHHNNIGSGVGSRVWIVDQQDHNKLLPIGAIGELLIESTGVGRGYVSATADANLSFLSSTRWLRNLRAEHPRLYKTGDLGHYNADGSIAYIGRKDTQVKVRGQRVELAEVQHHIDMLVPSGVDIIPEVGVPYGTTSSQLVAFVILGKTTSHESNKTAAILQDYIDDIQRALGEYLPAYMIPTLFIPLREVPVTGSNKTDRRKLKEIISQTSLEQLAAYQDPAGDSIGDRRAPATEMETRIQNLWASTLKVTPESISADDSFLQIGGDSVAVIKLLSAARKDGLRLTAAEVYQNPRLTQLAQVADSAGTDSEEDIPPFSLIGHDTDNLRHKISAQLQLHPSDVEDAFPCTPLQEGLLALTAARPGHYVGRFVLELSQDIDTEQFQRAWEQVLQTDAKIMRTRILDMPELGLLVQVIVQRRADWGQLQSMEACLWQHEQFEMGLGTPLAHFSLAQEGLKRYFILSMHHAIYDGWTTPLILEKVNKAYKGFCLDISPSFQSFINYINSGLRSSEDYWRNQLAESTTTVFPSLPSPRHQPQADKTLDRLVDNLSWPQTGVTASSVVRATLAILIASYTGENDVAFGAVTSGRQAPVSGVQDMIGPTIATMPIAIGVDPSAHAHELLAKVQQQAVDMVPFEQTGLQRIRRISESAASACRFQTLLVVQPETQSPSDEGDRNVFRPQDNEKVSTSLETFNPYGLMVVCGLSMDSVRFRFSYDSVMISTEQVSVLARQIESVLRRLCVADMTATVASVVSAGNDDLQNIWEWNTPIPETVADPIHFTFAEQVRQRPEAQAVCAWDGDLTYRQLDDLSTLLAHQLAALGICRGEIVPLCIEKSRFMPIAMLGVMKSGGASVAIDMSLPWERLQSIVDQVSSRVILTSPQNHRIASSFGVQKVLVVDDDRFKSDQCSPSNSLPAVDASDTAYVVFTSGTTGTPKGAVITHENFSSAILHQQRLMNIQPDERIFDFASYAFDAAWANALHSFTSGACLCIPSESERKDDIEGSMLHMKVTFADLTPSTARILDPAALPSLSTLILAGEAMSQQDVDRWADRVTLKNVYGPAECTVTATISETLTKESSPANIGHGHGLATWVVNQEGNGLVPIGAIGELWLEGPLVGAGYLGNAEKTAASFVEDPEWLTRGSPGYPGRRGKLYKTGDLVRYNTDGSLMFIGRKDAQVKIRGQRTELGDVEHHVQNNFPGAVDVVAEAVTLTGQNQKPVLVAFVHSSELLEQEPSDKTQQDVLLDLSEEFLSLANEAEVRLQEVVPPYMIPTIFLPIRFVPTNLTGKTNRRLLRNLVTSMDQAQLRFHSPSTSSGKAPSSENEFLLQRLWAETLNLDTVAIGTNDNWFKLGGDSITSMQLSAKCRAAGLRISVAQVFQQKTIENLARAAVKTEKTRSTVEERFDVSFPLSPIQQWFFDTQPQHVNNFTQAFLVRVSKPVSQEDLVAGIDMLVLQHTMLRARFPFDEAGHRVQMVRSVMNGNYTFETLNCATLSEADQHIDRLRESLDIEHGPLLAVMLIESKAEGQHVFSVAHHLVIDLVSWRILLGDLENILLTGAAPVKALPFQTWCSLQTEYSERHLTPEVALPFEVKAPDLKYWGANAVSQNRYEDINVHTFTLPESLTKKLLRTANNAFGTQPVDIFQAAIWHSFRAIFSNRDVPAIFSEGHGREPWDDNIDVSRTVGWFTTMWPTALPADAPLGIAETVRRTKDSRGRVPVNGWAYFNSRYLNHRGKTAFVSKQPDEILFNYEGVYQQLEREGALFTNVNTNEVDERVKAHKDLQRCSLIDINVSVRQATLHYSFRFNKFMEHQDALLAWVAQCRTSLCEAAEILPQLTPSYSLLDFPLLRATYDEMDELMRSSLLSNGLAADNVEDVYPCLPTQRFMLDAHSSASRVYATASVGKLTERRNGQPFDMVKLKAAWQKVVNSHKALRTVFIKSKAGCGWTQIVQRHATPRVSEIDIDQDEAALASLSPLQVDSKTVPVRLSIGQTTPGQVLFRLDTNHAIMDAISHKVLFQQWYDQYHDIDSTESSACFRQHVGYVLDAASSAKSYWHTYLEDATPCIVPMQGSTQDRGQPQTFRIPSVSAASLRTSARQCSATTSTLVKTAWLLTLHALTGQQSVCFGYLESGRDVPIANIQGTVGNLLSILVCKIQLADPEAAVGKVIEAVQEDYRRSMEYQASGVVEALYAKELFPPSERLFNSLINYRSTGNNAESGEGFCVTPLYSEDGMESDLVLTVDDDGDGMEIGLNYWSGRCGVDSARRISEAFRTTLRRLSEGADLSIESVRPRTLELEDEK